jgi:hypothetical protein
MKVNEIKNIINQVIAEAKEKKEALPKSGGKLVHLKKENWKDCIKHGIQINKNGMKKFIKKEKEKVY